MPYYAMLNRLRVFLRANKCILLTCGYSFGDQHINAIIAQGTFAEIRIARVFSDRFSTIALILQKESSWQRTRKYDVIGGRSSVSSAAISITLGQKCT